MIQSRKARPAGSSTRQGDRNSAPGLRFRSIAPAGIRGTPLLVQILFVYFALPALLPGLELSDFWSAVLALSLNVGAYNSEVIRSSAIASRPKASGPCRSSS